MTRYFTMHPLNPQLRLIKQAAEAVQAGELIVYPTDSTYALGCDLKSKEALNKLRLVRGLSENHPLTLICHSIAEAAQFCFISDQAFKILKEYTPGPYTFILPATKRVPRQAQGLKRKVVGIRIPNHPLPLALISELASPLISATLWIPGDEAPLTNPQDVIKKSRGLVDLILDSGIGDLTPTTLIDLVGERPVLIRSGKGDPTPFQS